ncbi:hypothetical protein CNO14_04290 (plasmid) [Borrelia miyamotoi]|uniref:Lipoprotein n=1 Tax=Borrelia miyamotoi TaxID=47466 RepID=A0AAP8YV04_9SPIR|nr:hypothetical protein [Borrelia miyamotoi]AHH05429.1 hypothetical protein BOM_0886 [Borrelia miyamotoi FR64b]ATQ15226.1 hypothetical protein CNO14_04290 [Borrelia miyamotoi]ATQ16462.1 hypothetical protein CNO13_04575 [Borrelia miyamotoi]ATQ17555.1 hypothetical protein CNO12_04295 [Borrelia miyamotoi]ATQ18799.1 hypothetical protein CNO11_04285 [Borrelia miyamotoi]
MKYNIFVLLALTSLIACRQHLIKKDIEIKAYRSIEKKQKTIHKKLTKIPKNAKKNLEKAKRRQQIKNEIRKLKQLIGAENTTQYKLDYNDN